MIGDESHGPKENKSNPLASSGHRPGHATALEVGNNGKVPQNYHGTCPKLLIIIYRAGRPQLATIPFAVLRDALLRALLSWARLDRKSGGPIQDTSKKRNPNLLLFSVLHSGRCDGGNSGDCAGSVRSRRLPPRQREDPSYGSCCPC